ncbi:MAG: hypothetical protein ACTHQE_08240, partial [Thermomicrobiales bacterium]
MTDTITMSMPGAIARIDRRRFTTGALAALGALAVAGRIAPATTTAQSMDPYTYIRTMPATTTLGQQPGQPAPTDPVQADNA